MTKEERQQSLENARRACEWLDGIKTRLPIKQFTEFASDIQSLVFEFSRLDAKEQKQTRRQATKEWR